MVNAENQIGHFTVLIYCLIMLLWGTALTQTWSSVTRRFRCSSLPLIWSFVLPDSRIEAGSGLLLDSMLGAHMDVSAGAHSSFSAHSGRDETQSASCLLCAASVCLVLCVEQRQSARLASSLPECADGGSGKCWNAAVENETRGDGRAISRAVSVCLHVRQRGEMCVGGCEWVFAACVSGAPTAHSSSPRSLISSRLSWAQHIIRKQHGNTLMWLSSFISSLLRSYDLIR